MVTVMATATVSSDLLSEFNNSPPCYYSAPTRGNTSINIALAPERLFTRKASQNAEQKKPNVQHFRFEFLA